MDRNGPDPDHPRVREALREAERVLGAPRRLRPLLDRAARKLSGRGAAAGAFAAVREDAATTLELLRCWRAGTYRDVSHGTLVMFAGALVYLVMPIDAVPDAIPGLGLLDDAAVLRLIVERFRSELGAFRAWRTGAEPEVRARAD